MDRPAATNQDFSSLGIDSRRTFVTRQIGGDVVGMTWATADYAIGMIDTNPLEDAYLISYQRRRVFADLFLEDRNVPVPGRSDNRITVYDLRGSWQADFTSPFDTVGFHIPLATLEGLAPDLRRRFSGHLDAPPGACIDDPVIRALSDALMPAFLAGRPPEPLFVDHVGWALAIHVVTTYGGAILPGRAPGRLSAAQEARAMSMMEADPTGNVRLADLAAACGLSVRHFVRSFRATTGRSPHQWLQHRRVERAKALLLDPRIAIADIAIACGFYDQSHLTRIFMREVGDTPARWRASRLS